MTKKLSCILQPRSWLYWQLTPSPLFSSVNLRRREESWNRGESAQFHRSRLKIWNSSQIFQPEVNPVHFKLTSVYCTSVQWEESIKSDRRSFDRVQMRSGFFLQVNALLALKKKFRCILYHVVARVTFRLQSNWRKELLIVTFWNPRLTYLLKHLKMLIQNVWISNTH